MHASYDERLRPTPLETAAGLALGPDPGAEQLPVGVRISPHEALRNAVRAALRRPPCVVAFSGGRDSSALLAVATDVARKEGFALPIPVTMRFPHVPEADETEWQELVVRHLRLDDWVTLEFDDELDFVGPWAQQVLRRYGLLWPANDYIDLPLLEQAGCGSFIDGVDGDSIFHSNYLKLLQTLHGRRKPGRAALRDLSFLLKSREARKAQAYRASLQLPWLTARAQHELSDLIATDYASEPLSFAARLRWYYGSRYLGALQWTTRLFAADKGVTVVRPLLDPVFLAALGRSVGRLGFTGRAAMMQWLFGDLLPEAAVRRVSKANFPHYWGEASKCLAASWHGEGVDPEYVDHEALRRAWAADRVDHRSALLLQSVWLARHERSIT